MKIGIKIKRFSNDAVIPTKGTDGAAGYDLYIPRNKRIHVGRNMIPLDIAIQLPYGYCADIRPRSGFSLRGIRDINGKYRNADELLGTIDSDYRGNISLLLYSRKKFTIAKGERVAQLLIHKVEDVKFNEVFEIENDTERGTNGFGSTNK